MTPLPDNLRADIDQTFREYGPQTTSIIIEEAEASGGMPGLLYRLGMEDPGFPEDQVLFLRNFIRRHGLNSFLSALGRPPVQTPRGRQQDPPPGNASRPDKLQRVRVALPGETGKRQTAPGTSPAPPPLPLDDQQPPAANPPRDNPGPITNTDGEWDGVERRSGNDRRQDNDRRGAIDIVFKNRRYGKDRRSGKERRKDWPPQD